MARRPHSPESLVRACFEGLESRGIDTRILHHWARLPADPGGDIDCVVPGPELDRAGTILRGAVSEAGAIVVRTIEYGATARTHVVAAARSDGPPIIVCVDMMSDFCAEGTLWIPWERLAVGTRRYAGLPIADAGPAFGYYLLKRYLKDDVGPDALAELGGLLKEDPTSALEWACDVFGASPGESIVAAVESSDMAALESALTHASPRALVGRLSPRALSVRARSLGRLARRTLHPVGATVCILGADGTGKSTLASSLSDLLGQAFGSVTVSHLRPGLLPARSRYTPGDSPHGGSPFGWTRAIAKSVYLCGDYTVGYLVTVWPSLVGKGAVIFDRYAADISLDPRRYRMDRVGRAWGWLGGMLPQPQVYLVLLCDPEVAEGRTSEVDALTLAQLMHRYRGFAEGDPRALAIDCSGAPEAVAADAAWAALEQLAGVGRGGRSRTLESLSRFRPDGTPMIVMPPWGDPRVSISPGSIAQRWASSSAYPASRPSARIARAGLRFLATLGIGARTAQTDVAPQTLEDLTGIAPSELTNTLGSEPAMDRVVAHARWADHRAVALKSSTTSAGRAAIARETEAILQAGDVAPVIVTNAVDDHVAVLGTEWVAGTPMSARSEPPDDALLALASISAGSSAFEDHPLVRYVVPRFSEHQEAIRALMEDRDDWPLVFVHGDCAPWNALSTGEGRVVLVDWEYAFAEGFAGVDRAFWYLQVSRLIERHSAADAFRTAHAGLKSGCPERLSTGEARGIVALTCLYVICSRADGVHGPDAAQTRWFQEVLEVAVEGEAGQGE